MVGSKPLAKLSAPLLRGEYDSRRLLGHLEQLLGSRSVWICGPAGAGKTTLAGRFLRRQKIPCLWYQVDAGDADPAAFFHFLSLAIAGLSTTAAPLPRFTPEYQPGLGIFARRFFEALYQALPPPYALVFDDCQEAPSDSPFAVLLQAAVETCPADIKVLFTSRSSPPKALSGLLSSGDLEVFHPEELRLSLAETIELFASGSLPNLSREALVRLHAQSQGWTGGLILLAEGIRRGEMMSAPGTFFPMQVFDYFAGEIFQHLADEPRLFLLLTALLPTQTVEMAEALTGNARAGSILSWLRHHHLFTEKQGDYYRYHPLFREFLLAQGAEDLTSEQLRAARCRAGQLLAGEGLFVEAIPLLVAAEDFGELTRLVDGHAEELLTQGRHLQLENWLNSLPEQVLEEEPWLCYWLGIGRLATAPERSRVVFQRALERFMAEKDEGGAVLAWVGIVDSYRYEWNDFTPLDRWLAWFEELRPVLPPLIAPDIEARLAGAMVLALTIRRPDSPNLDDWLLRSLDLARASRNFGLKLQTYSQTILYYCWVGNLEKARMLLEEVRHFCSGPAVEPLLRLSLGWLDAVIDIWAEGAGPRALAKVNEAIDYGNEQGVLIWHHMFYGLGVYSELSAGNLEGASAYLSALAAVLEPRRQHMYCLYHYLLAWRDFQLGDGASARAQAEIALELAEDTGFFFPEILSRLALARVLHRQGACEEGRRHLDRARTQSRVCGSAPLLYACLLEEAERAFGEGAEEHGVDLLREAFTLGGSRGFLNPPWWWDAEVMARLCAKALQYAIEPALVSRFVRERRLGCEAISDPPEAWPWPVRIRVLGTFAVEVDGEPLAFTGRVQKKPLELLKVLIALGGKEVAAERIADLLWPEAEGDAAQRSFATTLHRLRQLLRNDKALLLGEGCLSLNPHCCWVDALAFVAQSARTGPDPAVATAAGPERLERTLRLYRGPFLPQEPATPWVLLQRNRLRQRFVDLLLRLGAWYRQQGDVKGALCCFTQGLDVDATAEELYRQIMRCHLEECRPAEVVKTFQQCEQALSGLLGVAPSAETRALLSQLST